MLYNGLAELEARFGKLTVENGEIVAPKGWESKWMTKITHLPGLPGKRLYCNAELVAPLLNALVTWQATCPEYQIRSLGCFAPRYKRTNGAELSVHTYGLAIDINASTNPLNKKLITDMPPAFVKAFRDNGFVWGGLFKGTKDPMHFQLVTGY